MSQYVSSCVVCGAVTDRFLCGSERTISGCIGLLLQRLGDCAALVDELDTTLSRQDRIGGAAVGYVSNGGDEQPLPLNLRAMYAGDYLRDILCSWARALWEDNATPDEDGSLPQVDVEPRIIPVSRWLMRHPSWIALHPAADEMFEEVSTVIRSVWRVVDTAASKTYLGPCLSELDGEVCDEDLWARPGQHEVRCRCCGATHENVLERQDSLSAAVEEQYVPMGILVGLINDRGRHLTSSMVRNLAARKRVTAWVSVDWDAEKDQGVEGASVLDHYGFRVRVRTPDDIGLVSLFRVGEVLNVITSNGGRGLLAA